MNIEPFICLEKTKSIHEIEGLLLSHEESEEAFCEVLPILHISKLSFFSFSSVFLDSQEHCHHLETSILVEAALFDAKQSAFFSNNNNKKNKTQ